jgi:hypothetical protein
MQPASTPAYRQPASVARPTPPCGSEAMEWLAGWLKLPLKIPVRSGIWATPGCLCIARLSFCVSERRVTPFGSSCSESSSAQGERGGRGIRRSPVGWACVSAECPLHDLGEHPGSVCVCPSTRAPPFSITTAASSRSSRRQSCTGRHATRPGGAASRVRSLSHATLRTMPALPGANISAKRLRSSRVELEELRQERVSSTADLRRQLQPRWLGSDVCRPGVVKEHSHLH